VESDLGDDGFTIAHLGAAKEGALVSAGFGEQRAISLFASKSSAEITLGTHKESDDATTSDLEVVPLIKLSENEGAPSIRAQDDHGAVLFKAP
jgi:hypothetical protein